MSTLRFSPRVGSTTFLGRARQSDVRLWASRSLLQQLRRRCHEDGEVALLDMQVRGDGCVQNSCTETGMLDSYEIISNIAFYSFSFKKYRMDTQRLYHMWTRHKIKYQSVIKSSIKKTSIYKAKKQNNMRKMLLVILSR